jgi:hypothetical protein
MNQSLMFELTVFQKEKKAWGKLKFSIDKNYCM